MSEIQIVQFFNSLGQGTFVDTFTILFSSIIFLILFWLILTIIAVKLDKKTRKYFLLSIIIAIPLYYLFSDIIFKQFLPSINIFRFRPYLAYPNLIKSLGQLFVDSSFPSSHMTNTSAILTVFVYYYRKTIIPAIVFIILMAFARMHNGMHYPTDVLGGIIIGILVGSLAIYLTKLILTKYHPLLKSYKLTKPTKPKHIKRLNSYSKK